MNRRDKLKITTNTDDLKETDPHKVFYACPICEEKNLSIVSGLKECEHLESIAFSTEVHTPLFDKSSIWQDSYEALCVSLGIDFRDGERLPDLDAKLLMVDFLEKELDENFVLVHQQPPLGDVPSSYAPGVETFLLYKLKKV